MRLVELAVNDFFNRHVVLERYADNELPVLCSLKFTVHTSNIIRSDAMLQVDVEHAQTVLLSASNANSKKTSRNGLSSCNHQGVLHLS